mgnify:CR=1 FL=1
MLLDLYFQKRYRNKNLQKLDFIQCQNDINYFNFMYSLSQRDRDIIALKYSNGNKKQFSVIRYALNRSHLRGSSC